MSALQQLEQVAEHHHHAASRDLAKLVYAEAMRMIQGPVDMEPRVVYSALTQLFKQSRDNGDTIKRDAYAEVLDALEELYPRLVPREAV